MDFTAKNRIPHSNTCKKLIELQVLNDELLKSILVKGRLMLSRFSARVLIEAINIWIKRKLMCSLQKSSYFFILADECQDISTQEDLSICGRWLMENLRAPLTLLHVRSADASVIW